MEKEIKLNKQGKEHFSDETWLAYPFFYVRPHPTDPDLIMVRYGKNQGVASFFKGFFTLTDNK